MLNYLAEDKGGKRDGWRRWREGEKGEGKRKKY